jgi:hypothetical protein
LTIQSIANKRPDISMFHDFIEFFRMIYDFFVHGTKLTYAAMGVGLVMAVLYFRIFFKNIDGFMESLSGDWRYPRGSPLLWLWIMVSAGSGVLAYYQLPEWFPHFFGK